MMTTLASVSLGAICMLVGVLFGYAACESTHKNKKINFDISIHDGRKQN